jgi:soluble lytic murein transglycosylase
MKSKFTIAALCAAGMSIGLSPMPAAIPAPQAGVESIRLIPDSYRSTLPLANGLASQQDVITEMRRGLTALRAGDARTAIAAFERVAARAPGIADWARVYAAEAAATLGDVSRVRSYLADLDPALAREWGWKIEVTALRKAGLTDAALDRTEDAFELLQDASRRAEAGRTLGELLLARRDSSTARIWFRRTIAEAPLSAHALEAARILSAMPRPSAEDEREIGVLYIRHGNLQRGIAGLDRFISSGRGSAEQRAVARLDVARALFSTERYTEAERRLISATNERSADAVDAEALLLLGRVQYRRDKVTAARATLMTVAERFPNQRAASEALFIVADLDHDRGMLGSARDLYSRSMQTAPTSDQAGEAAMRLGGLAVVAGDMAEASRIFEQYRTHHGSGPRYAQASYWAARVHLERRDTAKGNGLLREVVRLDPASYYGLRASDLLGARWTAALAPEPVIMPEILIEIKGALERLDVLSELGLQSAVTFEMDRLKRTFPRGGGLYALAEGFHARGETLTAVRLGRDIYRLEGAWNPRLLRIVYPFPYRAEIVAQAKSRGLDPFLVAGLIRQESLFNPGAKSSAGAVGLMQVRPPTGRALARRDGVRNFRSTQLNRPEMNLRLGTLFFADLLERYSGTLPHVLAAYNAGPSRAARWRTLPEAADPDLFAERIPFAETRDYVKVVQQNARIYAGLYTE